jgi:murein DD-endopeptidase MepM/ murein hydrolase activator NlpD
MSARRWILPLGVAAAIVAVVGGGSPSIAQRLPRFFFPAVAAVGGVLAVVGFARALGRAARQRRAGQPGEVVRLLVTGVAVIVFALVPSSRLLGVLTAPAAGPPRILAGFGDWLGGEGYPRLSPHRGLDFKGPPGADVIAAADGKVTVARDNRDLCGLIVVVLHDPHGYRTVYCHLSESAVRAGDHVTRGQRIGVLGTTGQRAWPGYEHVHLELQRGADPRHVEDPTPRLVGCFDPRTTYPVDRLVITYPVRC